MKNRKEETTEESLMYRKAMQVCETIVYRGYALKSDSGNAYPVCPKCDTPFECEYQAYCSNCGQKLKWTNYCKAKVRYCI